MQVPDRSSQCNSTVGQQEADDEEMLNMFQEKINIIQCKVPKQANGYDCGVYVVMFVKMILDVMPRTTRDHLKDSDLSSQLDGAAFTQPDVDTERQTIRDLIER